MQNAQLLEDQLSREEIFSSHYSWLLQWALRMNEGRRSEAEDLVHDLYIQLVRLRPCLHHDADHIRGYLYAMLRNMHLSRLRRAKRSPICELSVIDYDSFEQGIRRVPERSLPAASAQLWEVCAYMCERKKRSVSASALILRFFLGYFPGEIARIFKIKRAAVDKHLHTARREARLSVYRPGALRILKRRINRPALLPNDSQELFHALRSQIFRSREGECPTREMLQHNYACSSFESLNTAQIAHLVSCSTCLDELNQILGLSLLADRCPSKTLGRDGGPPSRGGAAGDGSFYVPGKALRRLEEENAHRPASLQIVINGEIRASHPVGSAVNEIRVETARNEQLAFLEIFSEQNIRLLYLPWRPGIRPPDLAEEARIRLSDDRTLEVSVSCAGDNPVICVRYRDPLFDEEENSGASALVKMSSHDRRSEMPTGDRRFFAALRDFRTGLWPWFGIGTITIALLIAGVFLAVHWTQFSESPADLLRRAALRAGADIPARDLVRRTIHVRHIGSANQAIGEESVVEWISPGSQSRARRLYNQNGRLVVEEITHGDERQFYGKVNQKNSSGLDPSHLRAEDIWQIDPSAAQFAALIAPAMPTAVQREGDRYTIVYRRSQDDRHAGLVEASLVLRREDLHPIEEDLVLRSAGRQDRFDIAEASYEYYPPSRVPSNVFVPDAVFTEKPLRHPTRSLSGSGPSAKVQPDLIVHALFLLSQVGADMNGEANLQVATDGTLHITGIVASHERRDAILQALGPLRTQRGVVVHLLTPDEIRLRETAKRSTRTVEVIRPSASTIPMDRSVREFLSARGMPAGELNDAVGRYSEHILASADEALQHASALDRAVARFTPAQLARLSPAGRGEWIQIVNLHSSALLRCVQAIGAQLTALGLHPPPAEVSSAPVADLDELTLAADHMLQLSQTCDRDVTLSFTLSTSPEESAAVNDARFWYSLETLQSLARATATTGHVLERASTRKVP